MQISPRRSSILYVQIFSIIYKPVKMNRGGLEIGKKE